MANEVSTLNIGNVEYPIYGEGVRLENDYNYDTNYYFFLMGKGSPGDCSRVSTGPIGFGKGPNGLELNLSGPNINLSSNASMDLNGRNLYLHGGGVNDNYVNTSNIHLSDSWMSFNTYPGTDLGSCSIEMLQEDNVWGTMSNAIMINSDAVVYDGVQSNSYIYVNGPEIKLDSTFDTSNPNNYHSTINITDEHIELNQIYGDHGDQGANSSINLTDGKVTIDAASEVHIGDQNLEVNGGAQRGYISIGSNNGLVQIGSGAEGIWLGSCDVFGVDAKNNITLQRNNSALGNCTLNIGAYSRIIGIGLSESAQGIRMTTGERSTGDWNSVDIYGTTFSIRQVHNCDTVDEYENSIIMDEDGLRMQAANYTGEQLGRINIDVSSDTFQIYSETTLNIEGPEINIGATGGSSNITIGKTFEYGISNCEIRNPRIFLCKQFGSNNTSTGFIFEGGSTDSTAISAFSPYRTLGMGTVNLGGSLALQRWTNIYSVNAVSTSSDERLKNIVDNIDTNLDDLAELRKFKYTWKNIDEDRVYVGVSAQEIQKLYPEIVETDAEGYLSMSYERLSVIALAAIDKLHAENKQLKDRLTRLENIVNDKLSSL
jgi:hypothetical protein